MVFILWENISTWFFSFYQEPIENDEIVDNQKTTEQEDASEKSELIKKIKESKLDIKGEKIITKEVAASGAVNF